MAIGKDALILQGQEDLGFWRIKDGKMYRAKTWSVEMLEEKMPYHKRVF